LRKNAGLVAFTKAGIITCLFCFSTNPVWSQDSPTPWVLDASLERAYQATLDLNFRESRMILSDYPDSTNYSWHYLHHFNDAVEIFLTEDFGLWEDFSDRSKIIEKGTESPWKGFFLSEMALHRMALHLKFGEELSAAWQFRQAYRTSIKNSNIYPDFPFNNKSLGLEHILIGSTPDKYQWILALLGFEGTVENGFNELKTFTQYASPFQLESTLLLAFVYSYILQEHVTGLTVLKPYLEAQPGQLLLSYAYASILIKNGQSQVALETLDAFDSIAMNDFPFVHYQKGNIYLQKGDYGLSQGSFHQFLNNHEGHNYLKDAHFKLGLSYWMQGLPDEANAQFEKAHESGLTITEADKYAASTIRAGLSDPRIYRIRLYTDGGDFTRRQRLSSIS